MTLKSVLHGLLMAFVIPSMGIVMILLGIASLLFRRRESSGSSCRLWR